jgi:hypothetical protein
MRPRIGRWMTIGMIALALAGVYGVKTRVAQGTGEICKERVTEEKNVKMIKSGLPIWEAVTRHLVRM